jgi:ankyrin repeat protein
LYITALSGGYLNIVEYLIGKGANVNVKDNDGWTPLMEGI